jgi:hypothetical protein
MRHVEGIASEQRPLYTRGHLLTRLMAVCGGFTSIWERVRGPKNIRAFVSCTLGAGSAAKK